MERTYGAGLINLYHPVTKAFNHEIVIEQRGGRHEHEKIGNTKPIHQALQSVHRLLKQGDEEDEDSTNYQEVDGKDFDRYDIYSFLYGGIFALQDNPQEDNPGTSNCFLAVFNMITQGDYFVQDLEKVLKTKNFYDIIVYTPVHIANNAAAAYE